MNRAARLAEHQETRRRLGSPCAACTASSTRAASPAYKFGRVIRLKADRRGPFHRVLPDRPRRPRPPLPSAGQPRRPRTDDRLPVLQHRRRRGAGRGRARDRAHRGLPGHQPARPRSTSWWCPATTSRTPRPSGPEHADDLAEPVDRRPRGRRPRASRRPERGYRLVFNVGPDALNSVPHLHLHVHRRPDDDLAPGMSAYRRPGRGRGDSRVETLRAPQPPDGRPARPRATSYLRLVEGAFPETQIARAGQPDHGRRARGRAGGPALRRAGPGARVRPGPRRGQGGAHHRHGPRGPAALRGAQRRGRARRPRAGPCGPTRRARSATPTPSPPTPSPSASGRPAPASPTWRWPWPSRRSRRRQVNRIILTRPAVEAGERLGFLPGDLMAKVDPYLRPLYDALYDLVGARGRPAAARTGAPSRWRRSPSCAGARSTTRSSSSTRRRTPRPSR